MMDKLISQDDNSMLDFYKLIAREDGRDAQSKSLEVSDPPDSASSRPGPRLQSF
jgi:hypothetical protein